MKIKSLFGTTEVMHLFDVHLCDVFEVIIHLCMI